MDAAHARTDGGADGASGPGSGGGPSDAAIDDAADSSHASRADAVTRTLPDTDRVYANGIVSLQFVVEGTDEAEIDVLVDDEVLARVRYPYRYELDTRSLPEGEVTVVGALRADHDVAAAALSLVIDRTPPSVVDRVPEPNSDTYWVLDPIAITFSEPVVAGRVNASSIRVAADDDMLIAAQIELASDARSVSVTLEELPALPNTVTLTATDSVRDLAGNALTEDTWSFELPVWAEPDLAPPDGEDNPIAAAIAVNDEGEQFTAWVDDGGSVHVARRTTGAWRELPALVEADLAARDAIQLALDDDGRPLVAYVRDETVDTAGGLPRLARWDGDAWQELGAPAEDEDYSAPLFLRRYEGQDSWLVAAGGYSKPLRLWRVDGSGWSMLTDVGGALTGPVQSLHPLPGGDVWIGARLDSACSTHRYSEDSTYVPQISSQVPTCTEVYFAHRPSDDRIFAVTGSSNGNAVRHHLGTVLGPAGLMPGWLDYLQLGDADPEALVIDDDDRILMYSRGTQYVNGLVVSDISGASYAQPLGNWLDGAEGYLALYAGHVPVFMRVSEPSYTPGSPRIFDLVIALRNEL